MGKHFRAVQLPLCGTLAMLAGFIFGCGGNSAGLGAGSGSATAWPSHNYEGSARAAAFAAVAVDATERRIDPLTAELTLDVRPDGNGTLVRVVATDLAPRRDVFLHMRYDSAALHPTMTRGGQWMPEEGVFLGITAQPGLVVLGLSAGPAAALPSGQQVELAAVRFEEGGWAAARQPSAVSDSAVSDLHFDSVNKTQLVWSYQCKGDYDQNSEVGISDITPIGIHLKKTPASGTWQAAQAADGDANGEVNAADLLPIAANYHETLTAYQVKGGSVQGGPFANDALVSFSLDDCPIPTGGGFRVFTHTLGTPVNGSWYAVVPVSGTSESTSLSNVVQYTSGGGGGGNPPQNLSAAAAGLGVRLTWEAPVGAAPDSYNCYYALGAGMTGATLMNLPSQVTGLNFDCPLAIQPTGSYYFAVKAVYGAQESAYSNIFGFNTETTVGAPTNLQAVENAGLVRLNWEAATGSPDAYNCYVGTDAAMAGALLMNAPPTPALQYDCPLSVDPGVEHYFAVKALLGGTEGGYSNIVHYQPGGTGDTTPPVWQGGTGIKAATPAATGGSITVSWYTATDADSPPVKYLFYVVPEGTPIDWDDPADEFASTILSTPVTALADGTPLQNGQRYEFAVLARDNAAPAPNRTTNTNTLFATPQFLPDSPTHIPSEANPLTTSDNASVRVAGEEVPRMAGVNRSDNLYYVKWDLSLDPPAWTVVDLNDTLGVTGRKYHPQMVAIDDEIHLLFATDTAVYEAYGPKDAPASWQTKTVVSALSANPGVTGTGLIYSAAGDYLACVYAGKSGTEQLFYSDRDLDGDWSSPVSIMAGSPEIWQCDLAINETTGEQWAVAANGKADSGDDLLKFWYVKRDSRSAAWGTAANSGFGGDVMTIDIDYNLGQPVVACAEVTHRTVDLAGEVPVSDATIFTWTGNAWAQNTLETGDAVFDSGNFTLDTILTGQDPQVIFSPSGKAIALWSNLDFFTDIINDEATLTGDWRYSQRPAATWSATSSLLAHISSSNSVTAGESFQHCLTSDLGLSDSGGYTEIGNKYSERNNYVPGDMYYLYKPWN